VPPSQSRTHVTGRLHTRPGSSDGGEKALGMHSRTRTTAGGNHTFPATIDLSDDIPGEVGRRGSLPHLSYCGWTGPASRWNPSLPTQRGSVNEEDISPGSTGLNVAFKFGTAGEGSTAASALRAIELSTNSRRASANKSPGATGGDVFAEAEAEEAERQRKAFLAATYGADGRRARERLSLGGASHTPGGTAANLRRPSLMLWEKLGMAAASRVLEGETGVNSAPALPSARSVPPFDEEFGSRRGSLPIAIPGGGLGRSPSSRETPDVIHPANEEELEPELELDPTEAMDLSSTVRRACVLPLKAESLCSTRTTAPSPIRSWTPFPPFDPRSATCIPPPQLPQPPSGASAPPSSAIPPPSSTRRPRRVRHRLHHLRFPLSAWRQQARREHGCRRPPPRGPRRCRPDAYPQARPRRRRRGHVREVCGRV
jgi:hypothetical protein